MTADDLRQEIAASRRAIQADYVGLRYELDFATKAKRAVVEHPGRWLGGAALFGYLLSGRRHKKPAKARHKKDEAEPVKRLTIVGVILTAARILFPVVRPALTSFALRKISDYAGRR
ncbi:MAG TPA: hypothetical protein VIM61_14080 [Chthoniobacterales bacterium]|jgi:hypothetical protein